MNTQPDLFPETLLVTRDGGRLFTTSLKVAEHFKRKHKDVLRAIRNILVATTDEVSRRNFAPRDYLDERGKTQPIYEMTCDGFAIAVMGFTGPEALEWKWKFLAAFRDMERQLSRPQGARGPSPLPSASALATHPGEPKAAPETVDRPDRPPVGRLHHRLPPPDAPGGSAGGLRTPPRLGCSPVGYAMRTLQG